MIRIWQSYSCNNSSSYRVVATFTDAATAASVEKELDELMPIHAAEVDARGEYLDEPTAATRALGDKYGFVWGDLMAWGTGPLIHDQPNIFVEDTVLIVQHTYCGGGLGSGLDAYLEARGATVSSEDSSDVMVSLIFRTPRKIDYLDDELAKMFEQRGEDPDDFSVEPLSAPWDMDEEAYGDFTYFRDAGTVGLHFPLDPRDLQHIKNWLRLRGIDQYVIRIQHGDDKLDFEAIRKARCTSCGGALEYLHPALHDIESPQLVCKPCGGLYEVSAFTP